MNPTLGLKWPFSGPTETETETELTIRTIRVMLINIESLTLIKELILSSLIRIINIDILALQETCRSDGSWKLRLEGMKFIIDRPHKKYGSVILFRENTDVLYKIYGVIMKMTSRS